MLGNVDIATKAISTFYNSFLLVDTSLSAIADVTIVSIIAFWVNRFISHISHQWLK